MIQILLFLLSLKVLIQKLPEKPEKAEITLR